LTSFSSGAEDIIKIARGVPIKVLVWGPGDPGSNAPEDKRKGYEKRWQIRENISREFDNSEVHFSEDAEMEALAAFIPEQLKKQAFQANLVDLVLILDISRGADVEVDHFVVTYPWFRDKVYVLLPEKYVPARGLVGKVLDKLDPVRVIGYSPDEYKLCELAGRKTMDLVLATAVDMLIQGL
jgi:hypothetical protein